jgi:hypothetical protein
VADRDVEVDVLLRDKTGPGAKSVGDNVDRLSDRVKKTTTKMASDGGKAGVSVGLAFGDNLRLTISRVTPAIAPVLAGVGIAAAPLIGASISAAIIGGAGVGGVLGGVILASRDARVQAAAASLGDSILSNLEERAGVFVGPVLAGVGRIQEAFERVDDNVGSVLNKASTFVRPLVNGVAYAFERITIGFDRVVQAAGPAIFAIERGISKTGETIEGIFTDLSDNGVEAASAITFAFEALNFTLSAVGKTVNLLTEAYGFLAKVGAFGRDAALQYIAIEASAKAAEKANKDVDNSFGGVRRAATAATVAVKSFQETLEEGRQANVTLAEAQARSTIAIMQTTEQIRENNKQIKNSAERNAQNTLALTSLATQLEATRAATEKMYGAGEQANRVAEQNRAAFIAAARAAGYNAQEAENLANQYLGIPTKVDTKATMSKEDAQKNAMELRHHLDEIPRTIDVRVRVSATGVSAARRAIHEAGGATGFDAVSHFYAADTASGQRSRTGGVTPVSVSNEVFVNLDGAPFRAMTARAISASEARTAWRNKVRRS